MDFHHSPVTNGSGTGGHAIVSPESDHWIGYFTGSGQSGWQSEWGVKKTFTPAKSCLIYFGYVF